MAAAQTRHDSVATTSPAVRSLFALCFAHSDAVSLDSHSVYDGEVLVYVISTCSRGPALRRDELVSLSPSVQLGLQIMNVRSISHRVQLQKRTNDAHTPTTHAHDARALALTLNIRGHHPQTCMPPSHNFTAHAGYLEDGAATCAKPSPPSSVPHPRITPTTPPAPSAVSSTTPLNAARANGPRRRQYDFIPLPPPPRTKSRTSAPHRAVHRACIA
ncbi:hypothetical protein VTO73DRAFT_39 [Trametes versicolor]